MPRFQGEAGILGLPEPDVRHVSLDQQSKTMKPPAAVRSLIALLDRTPYGLVGLVARLGLAQVFWSSAQAHLANWDTTLYLFANSYNVPLLPPTLAAYLAVTLEIVTPPLLVLGLGTRFAALALLGMTAVIEIFVYPQAWPTHIQWAAMQLILISRGAGLLSLDSLVKRRRSLRDIAHVGRQRDKSDSIA